MSGERDTFMVIFNVFLYQIIFTGLGCFDFIQNFKRHILAPRAKTQEDMNTLMGGMELDIAERYSVSADVHDCVYRLCLSFRVLFLTAYKFNSSTVIDNYFIFDGLVFFSLSCCIILWGYFALLHLYCRQISVDGKWRYFISGLFKHRWFFLKIIFVPPNRELGLLQQNLEELFLESTGNFSFPQRH